MTDRGRPACGTKTCAVPAARSATLSGQMIRSHELTFAYAGSDAPAVRELTFEVPRGEIFGFLGPSGSGKSTTQKVLIGLLSGYGGRVEVLGKPRSDWTPEDCERIGVSFETPNHFLKLTAIENLRYFAALYRRPKRPPESLLETVGLGADGHVPVGEYSKGMKGRLSVARCLLHDPELLFLDEPTVGLDPVNAQRVTDLIRREREAGKTVFLTTHDMALADELCDRVAFIVDGRIVLVDSPRQLKLQHGERTVRVEHQAEADGEVARSDFPLDGLADDERFLAILRGGGLQTIHSREASLADVFIHVTGRRLR
jgi:fluoroquinolone transport system ATP-binding protein